MNILRTQLRGLSKGGSEAERLEQLEDLCRKVHALIGNAGIAGMQLIAQFSDALEALLKELSEKPKSITASTLRTAASAIDFLGVLFEPGSLGCEPDIASARILVVDDEELSRRAVVHALEKARLPSVNVAGPQVALKMLAENSYDLILLDVDMPGINGFELCAKLRALPAHKKTPVIFVTKLGDFETRANSTISGGNDLINGLGIKPSPLIGGILNALLAEVLDDPAKNTKDYLVKRAEELRDKDPAELKALGEAAKEEEERRHEDDIRRKYHV